MVNISLPFHLHICFCFGCANLLVENQKQRSFISIRIAFLASCKERAFWAFLTREKDSSKKKAFYFLFYLKASMRTLNDVIYMYVSYFHQRDLLRFTYQNKIIIVITCLEVALSPVLFSVIADNFHKESAQK